MKAAILIQQGAPLVLADLELPKELGFGQVLVEVHYSGICGSQIGEMDGVKGEDQFLPHLLGHEGSGMVLEIGPGVKRVQKGDSVVLHWRKAEGIQSETPIYQWSGKKVSAGWVTTFNEQAVVSENRVTAIPKDFDLSIAPLFGCAVTTGLGVINNDAQLKIGQSVVVFGAGGVGLNVIQGAEMVSAHPIIAVDIHDDKLELAKKFGATHCFNSAREEFLSEKIRGVSGMKGADAVIDTTGLPAVIELAYELTQPQGRTILVGVPKKGNPISINVLPLYFNKVLTGSHGGSAKPHCDIPRYIRLYKAGRLKLKEQITECFPLEKINEAIRSVREGKPGRCVLKIAQDF